MLPNWIPLDSKVAALELTNFEQRCAPRDENFKPTGLITYEIGTVADNARSALDIYKNIVY